MAYKIIISPRAQKEIENAIDFSPPLARTRLETLF
jgi:hypothetical protein